LVLKRLDYETTGIDLNSDLMICQGNASLVALNGLSLKKRGTHMSAILQILSVSLFENMPILQAFSQHPITMKNG
jgi:hypothetical protein